MKIRNTHWLLALLSLLAMPAIASEPWYDHRDYRYGNRLDRQHSRIEHGIRSGKLTRKEGKYLADRQRQTDQLARQFTRDGYLNLVERLTLRHQLDRNSRRIYRLKHNGRYEYPGVRQRRDHRGGHGHHRQRNKNYVPRVTTNRR